MVGMRHWSRLQFAGLEKNTCCALGKRGILQLMAKGYTQGLYADLDGKGSFAEAACWAICGATFMAWDVEQLKFASVM